MPSDTRYRELPAVEAGMADWIPLSMLAESLGVDAELLEGLAIGRQVRSAVKLGRRGKPHLVFPPAEQERLRAIMGLGRTE